MNIRFSEVCEVYKDILYAKGKGIDDNVTYKAMLRSCSKI
jgi:hypothetical protein